MKKIITYTIIFTLINGNFSFSAIDFDKYALINAVIENNIIKVKRYLTKAYKINLKDMYNNTALFYAINNENYEISRLLLKNGANARIRDNDNNYLYCSAKTSSNYKLKKTFEKYDENKCNTNIARNKETPKKINQNSKSSFWNWKTIGGTIIGIGGVAALAGGGGGGGGDDETAKQENRMSPADRNYNIVGEVDQAKLRDVLNNPRYNVLLTIGPTAYSNLDSYSDIRVAYSLARGYTGKVNSINDQPSYIIPSSTVSTLPVNTKIKVAVLDSGVQTNHQDLVGNITNNLTNTNLAFNFCRDNPSHIYCVSPNVYTQDNPDPHFAGDGNWHGTFVAGIIGATYSDTIGVMGIAPESEIIPYRIVFNNGVFVNYKYIGDAFKYASSAGATVINNSYGIPTLDKKGNHNIDVSDIKIKSDLINIFKDNNAIIIKSNYINQMLNVVKNNDTIFVWAAGNEGTSQSGVNSAIPLFFDEFKNGEYYKNFINVVAYDSEIGNIASYSNRCGLTKEFCLTAPGTNIVSTSSGPSAMDDDYYGIADGTSFAAPMVSGAVAVLKGAFPYLTGAEITKLLFITARDLGELGVDDIYGWGMLDLERATRPVGVALIPLDNNLIQSTNTHTLSSSNMKINSKLANNIQKENLTFVVLDDFNRTFTLNLNDYITIEKNRINTIDILNKFGINNKTIALNSNKNFNLHYSDNKSFENEIDLELGYTISDIEENNYGFNIYYGNNPYNAFSNKNNFYTLSNSYNYNVLNPYFSTNSDKNFAFNNIFKINDKINLNFGFLHQEYTMNYQKRINGKKIDDSFGNAFSILSGASYKLNSNILNTIEIGILKEHNTILGSKMNGAFGVNGNNITYFSSLKTDINFFKEKFSLFGKINYGYTSVNEAENSLIKEVSNLFTNSFAIGLNYNFKKSNISLLFNQPVQIKNGNINIELPYARDQAGNLYYNKHKINLREIVDKNLQLAYNYQGKNNKFLNLGFIYKNYLENEFIFLMKLGFSY